jgi:hypothetical protein
MGAAASNYHGQLATAAALGCKTHQQPDAIGQAQSSADLVKPGQTWLYQ